VSRRKNTVKKIGKHVVTLGEGKNPIPLPPGRPRADLAGRGPSARAPPLPVPTYIDAPQLLARFGGRSHMWLVRLLARDPTFPRPVKIGRLRFWKLDDLIAWERAAKSAA
jgi:predicted DNA-binding transcriptional regulator AlpA